MRPEVGSFPIRLAEWIRAFLLEQGPVVGASDKGGWFVRTGNGIGCRANFAVQIVRLEFGQIGAVS
jgi:hypothetical protein